MRTSLRVSLFLAGLVTAIALLAIGAMGLGLTFENVEAPEVAYVNEEITVSYTIVLDGHTWDDVNSTGATYWDGFIGEFYNHTRDTNAAAAPAKGDVTYSVKLTMPATPGEFTLWGWGHVKGYATDYTQNLGPLVVKQTPVVQFAGTLGWNLVGRDHEVMANVRNADPSEIEEVSVYWDTVTHRDEGPDKALYPNRTEVITYQLLTPFYFNITLPDEQSIVFIMVHGLINGRDFYDSAERSIGVNLEPKFNVTAPVAAFEGTNAVINWSIPTTAGAYIENTSVYWDKMSHSSAMDIANYAFRSDVLDGNAARTYEVMLAVPNDAEAVYFIVHCAVKMYGYEFVTDVEHTVEIIEEPTVEVTEYPGSAFVGADVGFVWTVSAPAGAVEETAIHWDTTSHAGSINIDSYPEASVWMIGEDDRTYDVTFEMPDDPGTLYFIAHARVLGADFYVAEELSITLRDVPTISFTSIPEEGYAKGKVEAEWKIEKTMEGDDFATYIHWDTTSHADTLDPQEYSGHSEAIDWDSANAYSFELTMPDDPGTLFVLLSADVEGVTVVASQEGAITVKALPKVENVTAPDKAVDGGKKATITFSLEDVTDPDNVEVLWDTESHANETGYANTATATDNGDGTWSADIKTPEKSVDVFYRVHVEDDGNHGYTPEASFQVKEVADDSPGAGFVMAVVALSLLAVLIANARRR
jgi:hypothetical protein